MEQNKETGTDDFVVYGRAGNRRFDLEAKLRDALAAPTAAPADLEALKALALAAKDDAFDAGLPSEAAEEFMAKVSPAVVLALIDRIARAEALAPADLYEAILALPSQVDNPLHAGFTGVAKAGYGVGFRDAIQAAADFVLGRAASSAAAAAATKPAALESLRVGQQAVPEAFVDFWQMMVEHGQFDGAHGYGVFYERHAKSLHRALLQEKAAPEQPLWDDNGEPWNEAAEKVERERAHVMPPFAAPASRVHFDDAAIEQAALKHVAKDFHMISHLIPNYRCTEQFTRLKAFAEELASGFREGRNTSDECTVESVSSGAPSAEDVRDAALEEAIARCEKRLHREFPRTINAVQSCIDAIRALKGKSGGSDDVREGA